MVSIHDLIKYAEAQSVVPETKQAPKVAHVETSDIEKFASYIANVGNLLKLGQDAPQGPGPAVMPPVAGEQKPVDDESTTHDPTESKMEEGGQVKTTLETPVKGEQQPTDEKNKISSIKTRLLKIAQGVGQVGTPPSDKEQKPGNVGYTAPGDATGLPEDAKQTQDVAHEDTEEAYVADAAQPLFDENLQTSAETMSEALPIASKETEAPTPDKPSSEEVKAASYKQGQIAAHSFLQELVNIYNGGSR